MSLREMSEMDLAITAMQEEPAELIQAMCKFVRFGLNKSPKDGKTAVNGINEEIGDVLGSMDWFEAELKKLDIELDWAVIEERRRTKRAKVMAWHMQSNGEFGPGGDNLSQVIHDVFPAGESLPS